MPTRAWSVSKSRSKRTVNAPDQCLILYGPPGAGKDTITDALRELDHRYAHFPRLKVGGGRTRGYRMTTDTELDRLRARAEVIWQNHRYNATYVVDRDALLDHLSKHISVLHLGQIRAIDAVLNVVPEAR